MYDILGIFKNLDPKMTPVKEDVKTEPTYENVEPRGSIMEAVKNLEEKYMGFKKTVASIAKGGSAEDPEAVAAAIGRKKYGKKFQKAAAAGKKLGEDAKPDFLDLDDDGDTDEPMKDAAKDAEPAKTDKSKAEKRKRLQALKDKQEDERAEKGDYDDKKSSARVVKGRAYGGSAQKDDDKDEVDESGLQAYLGKKKYGKEGMKALQQAGREGASKETMAKLRAKHDKMDEVAPPGAKAERMVKHIKKGYAKDGKLSKKEKGIAYATAWKAHKAGKLQESRMMEDSDYMYERIGKALAEKNPTLNTADPDFKTAVRKEMVAQGMDVNRARNIIDLDEDFIGDVATSYAHNCKEIAECGSPMNSFVQEDPIMDVQQELDEIAALAGVARAAAPAVATAVTNKVMDKALGETEVYNEVNVEESPDTMDEALDDEAKLERYHELIKRGMDPDDAEVEVFNDEGDEDLDEDTMGEGNEFSGALAKARAAGAKEFEVDGKKYTVKEDVNINISANGEEDAMNLIRKLAGMPEVETPASDEGAEVEVDEARNVEYTNTPREETAGVDAAIPAGADLNRAKKQYKKEYPGDNPMAVKEEALWKAYESLISEIKD